MKLFMCYSKMDRAKLKVRQTKFPRIPLEDRELEATRCLMRWLDVLKSTGINHRLSCGTALWLYRNGNYISHDLDLDIGVMIDRNDNRQEDENKIREAFKWLWWRLIRTQHYDDRVFQLAYLDPNDVIFDMTMYCTWVKKDMVVSYSDVGMVQEPENFFQRWLLPFPMEDYLEYRYWKDWIIPTNAQSPRNEECQSLISR